MKHNVVILSGKMGSGKDTLAKKLERAFNDNNRTVHIIAYADALRDELDKIVKLIKQFKQPDKIARALSVSEDEVKKVIAIFDTDYQFSEVNYSMKNRPTRYRELLQYWGTEVRRKQNDNYWVDKVKDKIHKRLLYTDDIFIVTDARFVNEIAALKEFNPVSVRLEVPKNILEKRLMKRDNYLNKKTENHSSECSLDNYKKFTYVFDRDAQYPEKVFNSIVNSILQANTDYMRTTSV